jgi:ATP adenylyltransferase
MFPRLPVEAAERQAYAERSQQGPCFICAIAAGDPGYPHWIIYEDEQAIVFLSKYQVLYGYTLVAPRLHREHVTGDFSPDDYLALQRLVHRVGEAVRRAVPTERLYLLSLGSQQGNRHVHWHVVPLPPGVPYEEQQLAALDFGRGVLELSAAQMEALAGRIRDELDMGQG